MTDGEKITYNFNARQSYNFKVAAATSEGLGPFSQVLNIDPDPNGKSYIDLCMLLEPPSLAIYSVLRFPYIVKLLTVLNFTRLYIFSRF